MGADRNKGLKVIGLSQGAWQTLFNNMLTILGMDLRSLALFRFFFGLSIIWDVINRWSDIKAHYSDDGFMPRHMVLQYYQNDSWITLHMASGTIAFTALLFAIHIVIAFFFTVGYRTRLNTFLVWFMTISLHNRNIFVLHGGDLYARCVLFFAFFLPLGSCWSVDNWLKHTKPYQFQKRRNYMYVSVATLALVVQMMCVYCTSYMHKTGMEWREIGTATWLALQLDYFRTPIGDMMLYFPDLLKFMTFRVLWWEGYGVIFLFIPIFSGPFRTFGTLGFHVMHLGFAFAMRLGQFACCGTFGVLSMLPTWFWETIVFSRLRVSERTQFKIHYHPNCRYCTRMMGLWTNFFLIPETQVVPILEQDGVSSSHTHHNSSSPQFAKKHEDLYNNNNSLPSQYQRTAYNNDTDNEGAFGNSPSHTYYNSNSEGSGHDEFVVDVKPHRRLNSIQAEAWLLVQDSRGVFYSNFEAVLTACLVSPLLWPLYYVFTKVKFLRKFGESLFNIAAENLHDPDSHKDGVIRGRRVITAAESWRKERNKLIKQVVKYTMIITGNLVCLFFLFYILSWNASNVGYHQYGTPGSWRGLGYTLHLDQSWSMFSPRPPNVQWYYNMEGELDNGTKVELWRNEGMTRWEPVAHTWDKPSDMPLHFKNHRWFKYYENGFNTARNSDQLRLNFGRYICREHNARHHGPSALYKFSIHWMSERTDPETPDTRYNLPRQTLWNHLCYEKSGDKAGQFPKGQPRFF